MRRFTYEQNNEEPRSTRRTTAAYEIVNEARASLKEPSRPFTPGLHQRSLLASNDCSYRPSSAGLISSRAFQDASQGSPWSPSSSDPPGAQVWTAANSTEWEEAPQQPRRISRLSSSGAVLPRPPAPLQQHQQPSGPDEPLVEGLLARQCQLHIHQQLGQGLQVSPSIKGQSAPAHGSRLRGWDAVPHLPTAPMSAGAATRPLSGSSNPLYSQRPATGSAAAAATTAACVADAAYSPDTTTTTTTQQQQQRPASAQPLQPQVMSQRPSSATWGTSRQDSARGQPAADPQDQGTTAGPGSRAAAAADGPGGGGALHALLSRLAALPVSAGAADASRLLQACASVQAELDVGEAAAGGSSSSSRGDGGPGRCSSGGSIGSNDPSSWLDAAAPGARPRLLAALGRLVDCPHPDVLLKVGGLLLRVAPTGSSGALLAARLMYQLSKSPSNDARFRLSGALPVLLAAAARHSCLLAADSTTPPTSQQPAAAAASCGAGRVSGGGAASGPAPGGSTQVLLYLLGALKHTSHDIATQKALVRLQALPAVSECLRHLLDALQAAHQQQQQQQQQLVQANCPSSTTRHQEQQGDLASTDPAAAQQPLQQVELLLQVAVQVTGLLRNLAVAPEHATAFVAGAAPPLRPLLNATAWCCQLACPPPPPDATTSHPHLSTPSSSYPTPAYRTSSGGGCAGVAGELAYNAARVLSKLSLTATCQSWLLQEPGAVEVLGAALLAAGSSHQQQLQQATAGPNSSSSSSLSGGIVLRLAFVLGNLTTDSSEASLVLGSMPQFVPWLLSYGCDLLAAQPDHLQQQQTGPGQQQSQPQQQQQQQHPGVGEGPTHSSSSCSSGSSAAGRSSAGRLVQARPLSGAAGWTPTTHSTSSSLRPACHLAPLATPAAAAAGGGPGAPAAAAVGVKEAVSPAAAGGGNAVAAASREQLLTKVVRLVANMGVEGGSLGPALAAQPGAAQLVAGVLAAADPEGEQEEMVLTAAAALTNLAYYQGPDCQLLQQEVAVPLLRRLAPLLLSSNPEAQGQAARALGNLARGCEAVKQQLVTCWDLGPDNSSSSSQEEGVGGRGAARLLLAGCVLLLDAGCWEVVGAALGALLNCTCGAALAGLVQQLQLVPALLGVLQRCLAEATSSANVDSSSSSSSSSRQQQQQQQPQQQQQQQSDAEEQPESAPPVPSGEPDPQMLLAADLALKALCNLVLQDAASQQQAQEQPRQQELSDEHMGCMITQAFDTESDAQQEEALLSPEQHWELVGAVAAISDCIQAAGWLAPLADSAALRRLQQQLS